jgi:hypothetical protein
VHYGNTNVTADGSGIISITGWVPQQGPDSWADSKLVLSATSDAGDNSNLIILDVRNPPGIDSNAPTLTTAQLSDPNMGFFVTASGFTPGEAVTGTADYSGEVLPVPPLVADQWGSVSWLYVRSGVATAGAMTARFVGAAADWQLTVPITGPTIGGGPAATGGITPAATPTPPPAQARKLPVVSG